MMLKVLAAAVLWTSTALGQYVPEPYGWACYRMALKREWPACKGVAGSKLRGCLCGVPEFVDLTEACLEIAVMNTSDPAAASDSARNLSLCKLPPGYSRKSRAGGQLGQALSESETALHEPSSNTAVSAKEIAVAIETANWRMTSDRRAERAGAALVGFWGAVILAKFLAFIIGGITPAPVLIPFLLWRPMKLLRARVLNPALAGQHHSEPRLKRLGLRLPTRSLTILLVLFAGLNYSLMFINYPHAPHNFIYTTRTQQWSKSLAIRSAFMIMWKLPLVFGFAARNNIFTLLHHPWDLDTFNKLHKWIARITVVDIIIHGIAMTCVKAEQGLYGYVWTVEYWKWGVTGVIVASVMVVQSLYWISRSHYEIFKTLHVALAVVFVIAAWFHVKVLPYGMKHVYAIVAIWGFDHAARLARVLLAGKVEARLAHLDGSLSVITIPSPPAIYQNTHSSFAFLYVLALDAFWQSHPFTLMRTAQLVNRDSVANLEDLKYASVSGSSRRSEDLASHTKEATDTLSLKSLSLGAAGLRNSSITNSSLTIVLKHCRGVTKKIAKMEAGPISLCLEGPYGASFPLHRFDQVIFIAGGIGITAHLSYIQRLIDSPPPRGIYMKLYWAIKSIEGMEWALDMLSSMVPAVQVELFTSEDAPEASRYQHNRWPVIIHYGKLVCSEVLKTEIAVINGFSSPINHSTAIFACGPSALNDDARSMACWAIENANAYIDYFEESFSW